jgi:imidazolonepropionase-like amidohydrolase
MTFFSGRFTREAQFLIVHSVLCAGFLLPRLVSAAEPARYAIQCGSLLDTSADTTRKNVVVITEGGSVKRILDAGAEIPAGTVKIDLSRAFCLPGLIDVHDHLTGSPTDSGYESLGVSIPRQTISGVKHARLTLLAGFTTVRNVGAPGFSDVALRAAINDGDVAGPRMFVSGPALGITGGHCDNNLLAPEFKYHDEAVADGPRAARTRVRENFKYGVDLIKICASGGVLSKGDLPGAPQYTLEEMKAIAEEAHKLGRKVAAHAHGTQSIKDAIVAGIDSIEHASLIDDEGIRLAKEHHTYLVFDIYNDDYILKVGPSVGMLPESIEKEKAVGQLQRANFRKAYLAGAPLAFGTDGGVYPHGDNAKQFATMVEFGMKPVEAIHAATINSADLLNLTGKAGVVKEGSWADVIAVEGDPTKDAELLQHVKFVMRQGKIYRDDWQPSIALLVADSTNAGAPAAAR